MTTPARLLIDPPASGAWNMAVDEALLETAVANPHAPLTLRWYRWSEPTLSLGYFQSANDIPGELAQLPVVRRLTGGGAIVHHHELTYALTLPATRHPKSLQELVTQIHDGWKSILLRTSKITSQLFAEREAALAGRSTSPGNDRPHEPFLCFERRAANDLVVGADKVLGSAQRSRRGALLQHGSLITAPSDYAPGLLGLGNHVSASAIDELRDQLTDVLASLWGVTFVKSSLTEQERQAAQKLANEKFGQPIWTYKR